MSIIDSAVSAKFVDIPLSPIRQVERYDPSCQYIKRYVPELRDYKCEKILDPIEYRIADTMSL